MRARILVSSMLLVLAAGVVWLSGCGAKAKPTSEPTGERIELTCLTNPSGTETYTVTVGLADVLSHNTNIDMNVQPTSGPSGMAGVLTSGEAELGCTVAYIPWEAYKGIGTVKKPYPTLRLLLSGHDTLFGFVTREDTGIRTIADIRGHKVTTDYPTMSACTQVGLMELKAYGLEPGKDVTVLKAENQNKGIEDLQQGRTDVVMTSLQGAKVAELAASEKVRVLPFEPDKISSAKAEIPCVVSAVTPKDLAGIEPGVPIVALPAVLWTTSELPEDVAYSLVKTVIEKQDQLVPIAPHIFSQYSADRAVQELGMPYHPGAIKYYREKGLWTAQMEQYEESLQSSLK